MNLARSLILHLQSLGFLRGFVVWIGSIVFRLKFHVQMTPMGGGKPLKLRCGSSDIDVFRKIFVDQEYASPLPSAPRTILDLGANTGLASLYFLKQFPGVQIVAVEPDPDNFVLLRENLKSYPNARCVNAAVWTHDGTIALVDPKIGCWGMRVTSQPTVENVVCQVPALSMATLLGMFTDSTVDLLKVDIEGAEREVFSLSSVWIEQVRSIVIELHDRYVPGCSRSVFSATQHYEEENWNGENIWFWSPRQHA